jgi:hypothetical protein
LAVGRQEAEEEGYFYQAVEFVFDQICSFGFYVIRYVMFLCFWVQFRTKQTFFFCICNVKYHMSLCFYDFGNAPLSLLPLLRANIVTHHGVSQRLHFLEMFFFVVFGDKKVSQILESHIGIC